MESARNAAITTITGAGSDNLAVYCLINNTQNFCQKSPEFTSELTPFLYVGQQYCITPGAGYTSGDSLTYELITPRTGITAADTVTFYPVIREHNLFFQHLRAHLIPIPGDFAVLLLKAGVSILWRANQSIQKWDFNWAS
ncbi:MAG: hypothetical protein IPP51_15440 [Bacteroidetes bacterium]|nr:hypothetical protein [Bacteroidota bacterium]